MEYKNVYKRDLYTGWMTVKIVEVEMGGEGRREKGFLRPCMRSTA